MFSQKAQPPEVEDHMSKRKKRNIRDGLGVADDSKSVNIIQYWSHFSNLISLLHKCNDCEIILTIIKLRTNFIRYL